MIKLKITKMPKSKSDKLYEKAKEAKIDELIDLLSEFNIDEKVIEEVKNKIKNKKPKRKAPTIPKEKQCTRTRINGEKCTVAACYKKSCWPHLLKDEREEYRKKKSLK